MSDPVPVDQPARRRIGDDRASTLFVEAGAGSGKTTALVDRVVRLVVSGEVELASIAAITFTEKAGAELRDRVRRRLEEHAAAHPDDAARCATAADQLDGAAIGTLHAFAQRLLREHPVEAGLPPRVDVLDEISSEVAFERRWESFREDLFDRPELERPLLLFLASGAKVDALRVLATEFDRNWDLVQERVLAEAPEPPDVHRLLQPALARAEELLVRREQCGDPGDPLYERLGLIADWVERLTAVEDQVSLVTMLTDADGRPGFRVGTTGRKGNWACEIKALRAEVAALGDELDVVASAVTQAAARRLAVEIRRFTLDAARGRQAEGTLAFHDLLVRARMLLRDPERGPAVRARLHDRYRRLLLDEFQDTDPIQIELAVRIAAADPADPASGSLPWDEVPVAPGHLFVVGDPKQSIYRFRRADIATFLAARRRFTAEAGGPVELRTNFRTVAPVIDWVNATFRPLFDEPPEQQLPLGSTLDYVALEPWRGEAPSGPAVSVIGRDAHEAINAPELRRREAADVVATIARVVAEAWPVDAGDQAWRPARLGDITVLVPARTSLPFLEDALAERGIPYRAEASSLVYASATVRDLLMVAHAVDDPTDHLRVVAALRSPLFGCGDDDLLRHRVEHGGTWDYLRTPPASAPADDPVAVGLAQLRAYHDARHWLSPSELLGRIAVERRCFELGFAEHRARDVWRRLRYVIDQARSWHEATSGGFRDYLRWVDRQTQEGARVAEAVLPETDDDAVRIMTIHAAKGLEFPVTILSGMSTAVNTQRAAASVVFPPTGEPGFAFGAKVVTEEFADWKPVDEQIAVDERIRLLYVAATRARDHLVVSLHRKARKTVPSARTRTSAELFVKGMGERLADVPDAVALDAPSPSAPRPEVPTAPPPYDEWERAHRAAVERASRPTTVAATGLAAGAAPPLPAADPGAAEVVAGLQKHERDLDLPPWLKGRYGTAVGRAVHGVLQVVDLATGDGVEDAVAAQCEAEAIPGRAGDVERLVRAALASPTVRIAARSPHWREVYACTPLDGGRMLEGYVDLLYRDEVAGGLVVVDHKTAATADPDELARRTEGYRLQGAAYAHAVGRTAGEPVVRVVFTYLTPAGAIEIDLPDLHVAVAEVAHAATTDSTVVTSG